MVTLYFNNRTFLHVDMELKEISELIYLKRGSEFIFLKSMSGDVLINPSDISYILEYKNSTNTLTKEKIKKIMEENGGVYTNDL